MEYLNDLQSREIRNSTIRRESGFFSIEIQQLLFLSRIDFQHNLPFKNWKFIIIIHTGRSDHLKQNFPHLVYGEFSNEIKNEKRYLMIGGYHNFIKIKI